MSNSLFVELNNTMLFVVSMQNNIKLYRERAKLTHQQLADLVGTSNQMIGYLERGERQLTVKWMERLAPALGVLPADLMLSSKSVPVLGYVGAGAEVYSIDDHAKGTGMFETSAPPQGATPSMVALVVRGDSMTPAYEDGDIIYYDQQVTGDYDHLVGKRVVARLADGRTFVKKLRKNNEGQYWLHSHNADPIVNPHIEWVAVVLWVRQD